MGDIREQAEKLVKKMSIEDRRSLMVSEGEYVQETTDEPYDQYEVGKKWTLNALSMPIPDVNQRAIDAMVKRINRGLTQVPSSKGDPVIV